MPNRHRGFTELDAQDAFFLRHHYGLSTQRIAQRLRIHPRTVVRYVRAVERGEIPWPPPRYKRFAQELSRHRRSAGWVTCPECQHRFPMWRGSPTPVRWWFPEIESLDT